MSDFDFGFTAVDESELEVVQQAQLVVDETSNTASALETKINDLYNAVIPLLSNLKKNPEKDYIFWPNRTEKIEQFEDHLMKIMKQ